MAKVAGFGTLPPRGWWLRARNPRSEKKDAEASGPRSDPEFSFIIYDQRIYDNGVLM